MLDNSSHFIFHDIVICQTKTQPNSSPARVTNPTTILQPSPGRHHPFGIQGRDVSVLEVTGAQGDSQRATWRVEVSEVMGLPPIAGWFLLQYMENPRKKMNDFLGRYPHDFGNLHVFLHRRGCNGDHVDLHDSSWFYVYVNLEYVQICTIQSNLNICEVYKSDMTKKLSLVKDGFLCLKSHL
jgi:hypothetical protein